MNKGTDDFGGRLRSDRTVSKLHVRGYDVTAVNGPSKRWAVDRTVKKMLVGRNPSNDSIRLKRYLYISNYRGLRKDTSNLNAERKAGSTIRNIRNNVLLQRSIE